MGEDKEIDLGDGCKITVKKHETGARDFCLNCDGEEQMTFSYTGKGTKVDFAKKAVEKFTAETQNNDFDFMDFEE
jgi:hypothetical protein